MSPWELYAWEVYGCFCDMTRLRKAVYYFKRYIFLHSLQIPPSHDQRVCEGANSLPSISTLKLNMITFPPAIYESILS